MENFWKMMRLINESGKHRYHATLARSTTVYFAPKSLKSWFIETLCRTSASKAGDPGEHLFRRDYFLTLMGILCHAIEQPSCLIIRYNFFRLFRALSDVACIIYETISKVFPMCSWFVCMSMLCSDQHVSVSSFCCRSEEMCHRPDDPYSIELTTDD